MKLAVNMAVMKMEDEYSAVAVGKDSSKFHGMLRLNETGADIVKLLAKDITRAELEKALQKKYADSKPEEISSFLGDFLKQLKDEGLLKE